MISRLYIVFMLLMPHTGFAMWTRTKKIVAVGALAGSLYGGKQKITTQTHPSDPVSEEVVQADVCAQHVRRLPRLTEDFKQVFYAKLKNNVSGAAQKRALTPAEAELSSSSALHLSEERLVELVLQRDVERARRVFTPVYPETLSPEQRAARDEDFISFFKSTYKGPMNKTMEERLDSLYWSQTCEEMKALKLPRFYLLTGKDDERKLHFVDTVSRALQLPLLGRDGAIAEDDAESLNRLFKTAKDMHEPVIVFLDDFTNLGAPPLNYIDFEHKKVLSCLRSELDELPHNKDLIVLAATESVKGIDKSLLDRMINPEIVISKP